MKVDFGRRELERVFTSVCVGAREGKSKDRGNPEKNTGVSKMPGKVQTSQDVKLVGSKPGYLWGKAGPS